MAPAAKSAGTAGYQIFTLQDHARSKGMWAGALERTMISGLSGIYPTGGENAAAADANADGKAEEAAAPTYEIREIKREHTPALLKIIDEGLVNASDHKKEHEGARTAAARVSYIRLDFDPNTGQVVIENDGPGIPILAHEEASKAAGHYVYVPEVAFAMFLAGRNMDKPPDSVKGGINGIGGKLINVHSTVFAVETVANNSEGKPAMYMQIFRDRMRKREDPKIFPINSAEGKKLSAQRRKPHTRITFRPAYAELGYKLEGADGAQKLAPQDIADIEAWCRWRMFLLAAYVGPKVAVLYNGERCPTTSAKALAELAVGSEPGAIILGCAAKATSLPHKAHPWDIAVAIVPSMKRFQHLSVLNGVHCAKGTHITYLKKTLNEAIGVKLQRIKKGAGKTSVTDTCKQIYLVVVGALPGADWGGQRKDELQVAESKLRPYVIASTVLGKIATTAADSLLTNTEQSVRARKARVDADKYTGAKKAGSKDSAKCSLLAAEGDSAMRLLKAGITLGPKANPGGPSFDHYGVFSLGGVTMNAMKKVSSVETTSGETVIVRSEQLRNNKVLKTLVEILGLDFTCKYTTDAEVARLRYGSIVICTDQDLDGTGKILPLVLVWFHVFWPNLISRGFVKRFMTPVIRVYPHGTMGSKPPIQEFFYENEFARWVEAEGGDAVVSRKYYVKYYKGLATHDTDEVPRMFSPKAQFDKMIYTFTLDDSAAELFNIYYGPTPALRKEALSTPVAYLSFEEAQEIHRSRMIPCSVQLKVDAKAYKLDDINRKIPGIADGIPVARRKVLAGALRRFGGGSNREIKVFQLGGYIAEHMFYHHGDTSLNGTIIRMAQRFPGALNYPYMVGIGQYGSRHEGGSDAGSPRYLNVRLAAPYAKAMFPAVDTWVLPHVFEDGERAQPAYFVGVLPTMLLESFEIPSEGWRHQSFARDFADVEALTRAYVGEGDPADIALVARIAAAYEAAQTTSLADVCAAADIPLDDLVTLREKFPLKVSLRGYGEGLDPGADPRAELIRNLKGYPHSFGWYNVEHNNATTVIKVTELPINVATDAFIKSLAKGGRSDLIAQIEDYSADTSIDIHITLAAGAWDTVSEKYGNREIDSVEDFLLLRRSLKPFLNYYGVDGGVLEFGDDYHSIFFYWAPLRRDLYRQRLERRAILIRLEIAMDREIVRYIDADLHLAQMADEDAASELLSEKNFVQFDSTLLASPRYTRTEDLEHMITRGLNISHDYLLSLRERDLVQSAKLRREQKIQKREDELREVEGLLTEAPFAGASVWRAEINKVTEAIQRGEKTRWRF